MPLCKEEINDEEGMIMFHFEDYQQAEEEHMRCKEHCEGMIFPEELQVNLRPKRNKRRRIRK